MAISSATRQSQPEIKIFREDDIPEGWALMRWINDEIRTRQPWKISIAGDLRGNEWVTKDSEAGGAGFHA